MGLITELEAAPGVYLVGFMGSGKSTVGRMLAGKLGWEFVDLDDEIEKRAGMSIPEIFEAQGEPAFRALECSALLEQVERVREGHPLVVALGGGAFVDVGNRDALEGVSIWLDCPVERLWQRVANEAYRPLAKDRRAFEELYEKRRVEYARANFTLEDEEEGPEALVERILELLSQ